VTSTANQAPVKYLRELMVASEAGDYEKLWNALPADYQKDVGDVIHSFAENMDANLWNQCAEVLKKGVRVLKEKQPFILGHPQAAAAGDKLTKTLPPVTNVLDAVINSELTDLEKLKTFDVIQFAAGDGKVIAEKMKAAAEAGKELQKLAPLPPGPVGANPFGDLAELKATDVKITLVKHQGDSATVRIEVKDKPAKEGEWVRVSGKWLPKELVDEWPTQIAKAKSWTATELKPSLEKVKVQVAFFIAPINMTLDQLLAAQTQEQFNLVIDNLQQQFRGVAGAGRPPG
jgi:hypothetical protein